MLASEALTVLSTDDLTIVKKAITSSNARIASLTVGADEVLTDTLLGPVVEKANATSNHVESGLVIKRDVGKTAMADFSHGVPNPLLPENRRYRPGRADHGAALGLAWDGDFDRCFFFDEQGAFIEGYYLVGLIAQALLARHPAPRSFTIPG